ncbi:hypothetical protein [Sphingobium yanoikuyae]|uniref:hypothetical protein n=1 Tax=Sphingobium yanoikuyae TaxID=13690 RepID=UPI00345E302A
MTPLERAAWALCEARLEDPNEIVGWIGDNGEEPIYAWHHRKGEARAVLNAIREPSDKVAIATASKVFDISSAQDEIDMGASCWRAGIDAMLEEG